MWISVRETHYTAYKDFLTEFIQVLQYLFFSHKIYIKKVFAERKHCLGRSIAEPWHNEDCSERQLVI